LCEALEIRSDLIAAYHHESAGLVERVHRFAHQIMQSANGCSPSVTTWDEQLPYIRFAIFSAEISKTKKSSFEICYGKKPTMPGDLLAGGSLLPKSLKDQYAIAQAAMEATRDYFLIQRRKTKVTDRLARDRGQRRIKRIYEAGEAVYVSKPSFTRLAGVRGLRKLLTGFRGPYEVARIDTHNNVYVTIDGEEEKFNVDRVSRVSTLEPIERRPPSYPTGRLTYTAERTKKRVDTPEPRASRHRPIDRPAEEKTPPPAETQVEEQKKRRRTAPREGGENDPKTTYVVIKDVLTGRNWPGCLTTQGELQTVQLLAKHKRGQFQRIWYNPLSEGEPEMIMRKGQPPKHEQWTVTPDATWEIIQEKAKYRR
jgi:hypothetical protein